jgi:hypothetical protein
VHFAHSITRPTATMHRVARRVLRTYAAAERIQLYLIADPARGPQKLNGFDQVWRVHRQPNATGSPGRELAGAGRAKVHGTSGRCVLGQIHHVRLRTSRF